MGRRRGKKKKEREKRRKKKKISGVIESLDVFRIKILKYSFRGIKASKLLRFASFIQGFSTNIFFSSFFLRFLRPTARSKCFVSDISLSLSLQPCLEFFSRENIADNESPFQRPILVESKRDGNETLLPFHLSVSPNLMRVACCEHSDFLDSIFPPVVFFTNVFAPHEEDGRVSAVRRQEGTGSLG